jgi:hypothetical protein
MTECHTFETTKTIHMHQQALLEDAAKYRLIHQARATRPGWWQQTKISVGGLLIALGEKLQESHHTATVHKPQAC